jgi:hypothetical protein
MKIDISEQVTPNGYLKLSTIIGNQYYKQMYIGHTKREAKSMFRAYVRGEISKLSTNQGGER